MANPTSNELYTAWGPPSVELNKLYSDGLQQYWDWLGDSFYPNLPFIGTENFGQAKASDLPSNATSEEVKYYLAAKDLATKLNYLNTEIFDKERFPGNSLAKGNWPLQSSDYDYYKTEVIPTFVLIVENLKVIQENVLISDPNGFNSAFGSGPFAFGQSPPENLPILIENVFNTVDDFLKMFPDVGISLQKDIQAVPDSDGLGPATILSDASLEASLVFPPGSTATHYIGSLLGPSTTKTEKKDEFGNTINRRKKPYLPVRLSPFVGGLSQTNTADGTSWNDPRFSILRGPSPLVTTSAYKDLVMLENKDSDGIEVPLGLEITIAEIVPSRTGVWVGFVSDDPRLDDKITNGQKRLLYTKAQYVRIKESAVVSTPDPYLSEKQKNSLEIWSQGVSTETTPGFTRVLPGHNWTKFGPNEVNLDYYSFNEHNLTVIGKGDPDKLFYNTDTLIKAPTLRYSEGYFYFITGDGARKTEAELINTSEIDLDESPGELNVAKSTSGAITLETIKQEAWKNLLNYLGKNTEGGNSNLYQQLYDKYFILADKKINTNSTNPNNQKALFAIRACYIDPLPQNRRRIAENFEPGSPFLGGRNYPVSLKVNEVKKRVDDLVKDLRTIKSNILDSPGLAIENADGTDFDIDAQITAMEELPEILNDFLKRQSPPGSATNISFIYDMVRTGVDVSNNHLIQIGIKDNKEIGGNVRETISYILFSPDPEHPKLKDSSTKNSNLFYLDPYLTKGEIGGGSKSLKRSAISLTTALPLLRSKLEGIYTSRALHLFLSYGGLRPDARLQRGFATELYMDWMNSYMVPPVRIYLSKDPSLIEPEEFDCDDAIRRLNKSGPNVGLEEKLLQEQIYNRPECMKKYYEQFKEDTPATSPDLSKKELEALEELSSSVGNVMENQYVKALYTQFFNILDMESMMALIMACLQKKLGLPITAEAICETAIVKLIENIGPGAVEKAMLANALLSPDSAASQKFLEIQQTAPPIAPEAGDVEGDNIYSQGELEDKDIVLNSYYDDAPLATSLLMSKKEPGSVVKAIRELEKGGVHVQLIPGIRPEGETEIAIPFGSALIDKVGDSYVVSETYTQSEIESEKQRLMQLGYSEDEARSLMLTSGYLRVNPQQYESLLESDEFSSLSELTVTAENIRVVGQSAKNWLSYMKGLLGLQAICELIVGDILTGLQDLLVNPGAFLSGGAKGWFDSFVAGLKKQFIPPPFNFKFPDNLRTDDHMGDYGEQLIKMLLAMVSSILSQIVSLLIRNALEQCLEEDSDMGPLGRPLNNPNSASIPIPALERADLPKIGGLDDREIVLWLKDILDNVSTAQLCSLLRGDATKQTLQNCLARTKSYWPVVYGSGIDTIYQIRVAFKKLGKSMDLDICDFLQSALSDTLVDNLCDAAFDVDARCERLKLGGLTEEECQEQIEREIEDLKNKVSGLASLSMFETNPLTNFPPICGENGSFVVPPGLNDTMERITDNMLTNVKGSLLLDMNGLKFFSTPPRALLALSDPNELKKTYDMFVDAIKDPYRKICLALIGDTSQHQKTFNNLDKGSHELYPVTYNRYIHYGNFSTWRAQNKKIQLSGLSQDMISEAEAWADIEASKQAQLAYDEAVGETGWDALNTQAFQQLKLDYDNKLKDLVDNKAFYTDQVEVEYYDFWSMQKKKKMVWQEGSPKWTEEEYLAAVEATLMIIIAIDQVLVDIAEVGGWTGELPADLANLSFYGKPNLTWQDQINNNMESVLVNAEKLYQNIYDSHYPVLLRAKKEELLTESGYDPKVGSIEDSLIEQNFVLADEELVKDLKAYQTASPNTPSDLFERQELSPMHVGLLLSPGNNIDDNVIPLLKAVPASSRPVVENYFRTLFEQGNDIGSINNKVSSEFTKDLKEVYLDKLVVTLSELLAPYKDNLNSQGGGFLHQTAGVKSEWGQIYAKGNTHHNFPGNINKAYNLSDFVLRRPWPLDTKLKNISRDPFKWYVMLRNYTGVEVNPSPTKAGRHFPEEWLENSSLIEQFDPENPNAFWDAMTAVGIDLADDTDNLQFFNWLRLSPGLRKLIPIMAKNLSDGVNVNFPTPVGYTISTNPSPAVPHANLTAGKSWNHNIAFAFMELTLAEALGLEYKRIKKFFPNMGPVASTAIGVMLSSDHKYETSVIMKNFHTDTENNPHAGTTQDIVRNNSTPQGSLDDNTLFIGYHAMYLVFEKPFRDPELPFNQSPDKIIDYFSMDKEKVNQELYDFLNLFPRSMGGAGGPAAQASWIISDSKNLEADPNFNPDILKYDLPFSEIVAKSVPGADGLAVAQEIVDIFSAPGGTEEIAQLASQIKSVSPNKSLINQNISTPLKNNVDNQLDGIKNISKFVKARVINLLSDGDTDQSIIKDYNLSNEIYNFNFGYDLDPEVQDLIDEIYSGNGSAKNILEQYNSKYEGPVTVPSDFSSGVRPADEEMAKAFKLHPLNFKAQIFGEFLTKKFMDKFNEYYDIESAYDPDYVSENYETFKKNLRHVLSTYNYSALQYAYSTQMFTKLKHSRLHGRGFMKKLWKKILKSPLVSGAKEVDPRCKQLLEQISAPSTDDLKNTTTDFFQLEEIKPKIIKFYKKSLCYDVYELSTERENAAVTSLIEGMIMLVAKIYTLEMCLASVIAWDSFDLADVFKDKSLISIIIRNISEDFDIEFLSFFANDILKKEKSLTEIELAKIRNKQSSIEYMITREVESISAIVKNMFANRYPLSADLQLSLLKNSDPDFIEEFKSEIVDDTENFPPWEYAALHSDGDYEYVVDARLKDNIYTMNYGYPYKANFVENTNDQQAPSRVQFASDIYGFTTNRRKDGNKNYLHSLPMTYYHGSGWGGYSTNYSEDNENGFVNWRNNFGVKQENTGYSDFTSHNKKQKQRLGHSDEFSHENNPEVTYGNSLNAKLGNIIFQPYVKVEEWVFPDDLADFDFGSKVYSEVDQAGDPCEGATLLHVHNASDYLDAIDEQINSFRGESNNVFGCHMYGYIPLSAWSYFYSNIFMKAVNTYSEGGEKPLLRLYQEFGLKPFFKKVSFGMRMLYCTSFPIVDSPKISFFEFMDGAFGTGHASQNPLALKKAKCLYGQRPYFIAGPSTQGGGSKLLREVQIPIIEVEKEINLQKNTQSFTVGESDLFSLAELGSWSSKTNQINLGTSVENLLKNNEGMDHLTKNTHQFFYKNLANDLLSEIKTSPEFKLMFDYLFPMRRYMALSVTLASDGLSKFVPEPTDILEETKNSLKMITDNLVNSGDYKHMPDPIANFLADLAMRRQGGTTGKDLDLTKEIRKIILKTSFYILKGFVEITDPAVMTAKMIIDIVNMVVFSMLSAIKTAASAAKQVLTAGITTARQIMQQMEIQINVALSMVKGSLSTLPGGMGEVVVVESDGIPIENWTLTIDEEKEAILLAELTPQQVDTWTEFRETFTDLSTLQTTYVSQKAELTELEGKLQTIEIELYAPFPPGWPETKDPPPGKIVLAEERLNSVLKSPYLLPGLWAALLPPMLPFGGGLIPPPAAPGFMAGPIPGTFPGMIYIALLLIDEIEVKTHDDIQKQKLGEGDLNCEDEL